MNRKQKYNRKNYKYAFVAFMMCLLYLPVTLRAENDVREKNGANLSGRVVDEKTQQPIMHANILIKGTVRNATTDAG